MRRLARLLTCLALVAGAGTMPAHAVGQGVVLTQSLHYYPGDTRDAYPLVLPQGASLLLVNIEVNNQFHSVTADDVFPNTTTPIFESGRIRGESTADVVGVAVLEPGTYAFHCSIDWHNMHGTLQIV